ncbi:MAG: dihydropteroate synthase [Lentisphaerae bacterium]|nr:dihydropteroate synthase [Lentisphaerota bacterium]
MSADKKLWRCRNKTLELESRPILMGVLNVTPDSFSDFGRYFGAKPALERALEIKELGADIIDIGGESSRPGSEPVPVAEEIARVVPLIEKLVADDDIVISVDTSKVGVAKKVLEAGAHIINDITAFRSDPEMGELVAKYGAGCVLMHMQGTPKTMQENPVYDDVVGEVYAFLEKAVENALLSGVPEENIAIDPGIGFGKTLEHNILLLNKLDRFADLGRPIVIGVSRKRFLGAVTGRSVTERVPAGLATAVYSVMKGASIIRAHDIAETADALKMIEVLEKKG